MILLASWCALRFGELAELRRMDVDLSDEVIRVRRGVVRVNGEAAFVVTTPKSDAGIRDVAIPPHLLPALEDHLSKHVGKERDSLLFPAKSGGHLAPATLNRWYYKAREKPSDTTYGSTTSDTPAPCSLRPPAPRSPNSWADWGIPHPQPRCATSTPRRAATREIAALLSKLANLRHAEVSHIERSVRIAT